MAWAVFTPAGTQVSRGRWRTRAAAIAGLVGGAQGMMKRWSHWQAWGWSIREVRNERRS